MSDLENQWKQAKRQLTEAQDKLLAVEIAIYNELEKDLPKKGTYHFGDIKIVTGFTEKWDQAVLNKVYQTWSANFKFPFEGQWKPDGKAVSFIRDNMPHAWKPLQEALTTAEKKPSFTLKE